MDIDVHIIIYYHIKIGSFYVDIYVHLHRCKKMVNLICKIFARFSPPLHLVETAWVIYFNLSGDTYWRYDGILLIYLLLTKDLQGYSCCPNP